ncbi:mobile mystery protein B [Kribbella jiaozuonensis]|uniref:Mobile mystery protein B n=1 Tax=Kribbella jiaozuonensis TaxID=2575441 RepID=A0A4V5UY34_9ACTN|nr:mobile mystery protein B [Kribbella jiaozuonensis]TKK83033.1 mobile mystery protein B [Kribbella jiaozuonensis]
MTGLGGSQDGQTPVDADDAQYLNDDYAWIRSRDELNDAEASNIADGLLWLGDQVLEPGDLLHQSFLRELHRRMFGEVWTWAGKLRQRDTTIGVLPSRIQEELQVLLGDAAFWIEQETFGSSEICVRFHHRLVFVHPFVNGNGRHARLAAGALADSLGLGADHLTWGRRSGVPASEARRYYLDALRAADTGDYAALLANAIS